MYIYNKASIQAGKPLLLIISPMVIIGVTNCYILLQQPFGDTAVEKYIDESLPAPLEKSGNFIWSVLPW